MRPTLRAVVLFLCGVPVALSATLVSEQLWPLWLGFLTASTLVLLLDGILALPRRRLALSFESPDSLYIGDRDELKVEINTETYGRPVDLELLCDLDTDLAPQPTRVFSQDARGSQTASVELVPRRRGTVEIDTLWVRWRGPLGLTMRQRRYPLKRQLKVVPNTRAVRSAAIQFFSRDSHVGMKIDKHRGDGSEFDAMREYVPGLDVRAVDWKHSARHRKLVCKEFRAERNHPIVLAIDTGHLMSEPLMGIPKLDWAINAGLLLGYVSSRWGDRIGLFGFDSRIRLYAEPTAGATGFRRLQQLTADLDYRPDETNFTLGIANLASRLKRRSLVVLLTDFTDTITASLMVENTQRLSSKHLVLFVSLRSPDLKEIADRAPETVKGVAESVVSGDMIREREVVLERLRRMGVHCIDAAPQQVSTALLNEYLHIKRRELI